MTERPILLNAEMVRAVLDGRKTQTRRIVKGVPSTHDFHGWVLSSTSVKDEGKACWAVGKSPLLNQPIRVRCPFGAVGDRLWVRETFGDCGVRLVYRADSDDGAACMVKRWTPSIHMPRWASRITLEITGVRVERLHAITLGDICKEIGCGLYDFRPATYGFTAWEELWSSIYGEESWQANPWVWVIDFKRADGGGNG